MYCICNWLVSQGRNFRCKVGWWGKNCEKCFPYPGCVNGTCNRPWECNCQKGWGGMLCNERNYATHTTPSKRNVTVIFIELTYCEENPDTCQNGAKCVSVPHDEGAYRCLCREGTYGRNCEGSDFPLAVMKPARTNTTTTQRPNIELTTTAKPEKVALVFAQHVNTTQNGKNYTDNEP